MPVSRMIQAIELERQLTDFLVHYAEKRLRRFEAIFELQRLEEITFGNNRQYWRLDDRFRALKHWFNHVGAKLDESCFNREMIFTLSRCVEKIGSYCRANDHAQQTKQSWFDFGEAQKIALQANNYLQSRSRTLGYEYTPIGLKLVRPPENPAGAEPVDRLDIDAKQKFRQSLAYQEQMMDYLDDPRRHLFGIVSYLFGEIEKNADRRAEHMAASILYFLKIHGYKVEPYVEKLRRFRNKNAV